MECLMAQPSLIGRGWWSIVTRPSPMPRSLSPQRLRSMERSPPNCRRVLIVGTKNMHCLLGAESALSPEE